MSDNYARISRLKIWLQMTLIRMIAGKNTAVLIGWKMNGTMLNLPKGSRALVLDNEFSATPPAREE